MFRYISPMLFLFLFNTGRTCGQQLTLFIPAFNDTCGTAVQVPVKAVNFDNLLALQGTLGWDTAKLSFSGISNFGPANLALGAGNFGTNNSANGYLTFSWNDANLSGESVADSFVIFTMAFIARNGISSTGAVQFRSVPTPIEAVDVSLSPVPVTVNNGAYNIFCASCDTSYWLGSLSDSWETPANWSCARVPDASTVVIVNQLTPFSPVVRSSAVCRKIIVNQGSAFKVNPEGNIKVFGIN